MKPKIILIAVSLAVHIPSAQADITSALIAHWTFDEKTGSSAADSSGNSNSVSLINFPSDDSQWVPGRIGGALYFNGDTSAHDDYVLTDAPINFDNQDAFSFSFWIKRAPGTTGSYPRVITPVNQTHWLLWGQGKGVGFFPPQLPAEPAIGVWEHYVAVYDRAGGTYSVFRNGEQVLTDVAAVRNEPGAANWIIGHNESAAQHGDHWFGELDDIRIYNRILSADDVRELFQSAPSEPPSAPVFVQRPQGGEKFVGENFTFSAYAVANPPVSRYQWQKAGQDIGAATNATFTLNNLQLIDSGSYTVQASNSVATATSIAAVLQVKEIPVVADITSGLIAHWKFDETNGVAAADASGNTNHGSLVNYAGDDSQWVAGRVGGALRFNINADGSLSDTHNEYVVTDAGITFTNQDRFTFTFWMKREDPARGSYPRVITPLNQTHWLLWGQGNGIGFFPPPASPEPEVGAWEHYAVVYDRSAGTYSVYLNGAKRLSGVSGAARNQPGAANWILGHNESPAQPGDHWFGELDDVRIYNRSLTPKDVGALFDSAPPVTPVIGRQSAGIFYKKPGESVTFSVLASGGQLQYQWKKGGQDIARATNITLTLNKLGTADAGEYTVTVSNLVTSVTGNPISLQVQSANTVDLRYGLIADWKFDETNGVAAADSSGRTNNASLINYAGDDSQWVSGRIGGALNFNILAGGALDPVHDNYAVTDGTIHFDNQDEFSFSYWIKRTEQSSGSYPRVITPFGQTYWILWGQGQGTGFYPPVLGFDPAVGVWQHYVVVYNRAAGTYGVYVDGTQKLSDAIASHSSPGETYWIIGHNENPAQPGDYWYGMLDDVRIYNRLLAPAEVTELAHLGGITIISAARSSNNVVISWPGSGSLQSASQVTGQWADVSGSPTSPYTNAPSGTAQFFRVAQ